VINKIQHLKVDVEKFEHENEREPMYDEVLNINGDSIIKVSNASLCLNDSINEDGDELYNIIEDKTLRPDDDYYDVNYEVKTELKGLLDSLDERERKIIECYFGLNGDSEPMTLEVIGEMFNLSRERVRQIKHKALRKLRHNSDNLFETL
jgi:RNA polymerase primary sigma factor